MLYGICSENIAIEKVQKEHSPSACLEHLIIRGGNAVRALALALVFFMLPLCAFALKDKPESLLIGEGRKGYVFRDIIRIVSQNNEETQSMSDLSLRDENIEIRHAVKEELTAYFLGEIEFEDARARIKEKPDRIMNE